VTIQTYLHSTFGGNAVIVEIDINDANWRVSRVRCINNSLYAAEASIYNSGVLVYEASAPPGQTTQWNIAGVQLEWDSINGGIMMGNYTMNARWPVGS